MMPESARFLLRDALHPDRVLLTRAASKDALLNELVDRASESRHITCPTSLRTAIHEREDLMSTGIGLGVGVPHARLPEAKDLVMAAALNQRILPDYEAIDGGPVRLVFLVAARPDQQKLYVRILAAIGHLIKVDSQRDRLFHANSSKALYQLITGEERG